MSISDYYYDEINSEENLQELDNQEPNNIAETMKQMRIKNSWDKWSKSDKIIYQLMINKIHKENEKWVTKKNKS